MEFVSIIIIIITISTTRMARAKDVEGSAKRSSARAFLVFPQTSKLSQ